MNREMQQSYEKKAKADQRQLDSLTYNTVQRDEETIERGQLNYLR